MAPLSRLMVEKVYNKMTAIEIIQFLPYKKPFFFVDELTEISENGITGSYTFTEKEFFL